MRIQRRMKAKILCLSLAKPHQALDAYMSFATGTARKTSCSESSHNPCLRRTRSAYRVCAQAAMTLCTCNVTDRLLVNVTPRILILVPIEVVSAIIIPFNSFHPRLFNPPNSQSGLAVRTRWSNTRPSKAGGVRWTETSGHSTV